MRKRKSKRHALCQPRRAVLDTLLGTASPLQEAEAAARRASAEEAEALAKARPRQSSNPPPPRANYVLDACGSMLYELQKSIPATQGCLTHSNVRSSCIYSSVAVIWQQSHCWTGAYLCRFLESLATCSSRIAGSTEHAHVLREWKKWQVVSAMAEPVSPDQAAWPTMSKMAWSVVNMKLPE